eukprot:SAG31_NODE_2208_length_6187_cov_5.255749_4_plen_151_part_00
MVLLVFYFDFLIKTIMSFACCATRNRSARNLQGKSSNLTNADDVTIGSTQTPSSPGLEAVQSLATPGQLSEEVEKQNIALRLYSMAIKEQQLEAVRARQRQLTEQVSELVKMERTLEKQRRPQQRRQQASKRAPAMEDKGENAAAAPQIS